MKVTPRGLGLLFHTHGTLYCHRKITGSNISLHDPVQMTWKKKKEEKRNHVKNVFNHECLTYNQKINTVQKHEIMYAGVHTWNVSVFRINHQVQTYFNWERA